MKHKIDLTFKRANVGDYIKTKDTVYIIGFDYEGDARFYMDLRSGKHTYEKPKKFSKLLRGDTLKIEVESWE